MDELRSKRLAGAEPRPAPRWLLRAARQARPAFWARSVFWALSVIALLVAPSARADDFAAPSANKLNIDESGVAAAGIRKLESRHLTLYTDVPPATAVDELPAVFDLAVSEWCRYFDIAPNRCDSWHIVGCIMKDRRLFKQAGLYPDDLPEFLHGFSRGDELWLDDERSDYFRRHLLLHEGTHSFMNKTFGSSQPQWYQEAMAELLGTNLWAAGKLTLAHVPQGRLDRAYWGRARLVRDEVAAGRGKTIEEVMQSRPEAFNETVGYAWAWALGAFLDGHPRYQSRFRTLGPLTARPGFDRELRHRYAADWPRMNEEWQVFTAELEDGYDLSRAAISFTPGKPFREATETTVAADGGWQNTGLALEGGKSYALTANGRYQVAQQPKPWWCEPGGVSIRYYRGRPLGVLLAAVRPERPKPDDSPVFLHPQVIGLGATLTPETTGTLYLKINDSPGELDDNAGQLTVRIEPS